MSSIEERIVKSINFEINEVAIISFNILPVLVATKIEGGEFNINNFLSLLEDKAKKKNTTILIPAFSREFSDTRFYNRAETKSRTGAISNRCLNRVGWTRTAHPMISFLAFGPIAKIFTKYICYSAFGQNSLLDNLIQHNPYQYFIGMEPEDGFTYLHYCEQKYSAPYRFSKIFSGSYVDYDGNEEKRKYEMYVKKDQNFIFDFKKNRIKISSLSKLKCVNIKKINIKDNLINIEKLIYEQRL